MISAAANVALGDADVPLFLAAVTFVLIHAYETIKETWDDHQREG